MPLLNLLISAGKGFAEWQNRRKAFAQLMALDDHSLADIGIRRSEIRALCEGDCAAGPSATVVRAGRREKFARKAA